jgi:hypothetical protein
MLKNLKLFLLSLSSIFAFAVPMLATVSVSAAVSQSELNDAACSGTSGDLSGNSGFGTGNCNRNQSDFNKYATLIVNLLSVVIGFVAVVMIIFGGFRYITSGGSSEKVSSAKNTIIYALIGLVIVALAQIIVQFVLHKADTAAICGSDGKIASGPDAGKSCK